MKSGRIVISIAILLGLLAGLAVPFARAQEAGAGVITFHVTSNGDSPIPDDAPDKIIIEGTEVEGYGQSPNGMEVFVQNLCEEAGTPTGTPSPTPSPAPTPTGTPTAPLNCAAVDVYYQIELTIDWYNGYYTDTYGVCCNYTNKNLAPWQNYSYGGNEHMNTETGDRCGAPYERTGSCSKVITGMIPAADISGTSWHEKFYYANQADYSGNIVTTDYSIIFSTSPIHEDCAGQFLIGEALGTFTLSSNTSAGVALHQALGTRYPAPGEWYVVQVTSGSWKNNNSGSVLTSMELTEFGWPGLPLTASPLVGCEDQANDTYYLQMGSTATVWLRVYDTDGNWTANSGSMSITVYGVAAYTPYKSGCELQYEVGDLIEQRTIDAGLSNGWPLKRPDTMYGVGGAGIVPTRYYMLETIGGPANLGADGLTWDADLGKRVDEATLVPSQWYEIQAAPFVTCAVETDIVGHVKVFFASDAELSYLLWKYFYAFRVRDTGSYTDNSGTLGYRLYEASYQQTTTPGATPTADGCSQFAHDATATRSIVIQGTASSGSPIYGLTSGSMYALDVVDGPWTDNGTDKYAVEISDDNGSTWDNLADYPNLLCAASADGDHVIIYLYAAAGKTWKVRADDGDTDYTNNAQSIGMDIYPAHALVDPWPSCDDNYNLTHMSLSEEYRKVPGNSEPGVIVKTNVGTIYSIEITDASKWYEGGTGSGSYLVDISDDGGATWDPLEEYPSLCAENLAGQATGGADYIPFVDPSPPSQGGRFRIFFTATTSTLKLRVRDGDSNFLSNTGWVVYDLYSAVATNTPPGPGTTGNPPPEWVVACNEAYARPNSFIDWHVLASFEIAGLPVALSVPLPRVGEWIEYLRASVTFYFAWCPQHTDALQSIGQVVLMDKEPMASIQDMMDFVKSIQTLLEAYQVAGGEVDVATSQEPSLFSDSGSIGEAGGGGGYSAPSSVSSWDIFMIERVDPVSSVWYGGQLDMTASLGTSDLTVMDEYQGLCVDKFYALWGFATDPFCSTISFMRYTRSYEILLLAIDIFVSAWFLLRFFPGWLKHLWNIITGNKDIIAKVIS